MGCGCGCAELDPYAAALIAPCEGAGPGMGWISPPVIYDQMRDIDQRADSLDADISTMTLKPGTAAAWRVWYENWKKFFADHLSTSGKFANLLDTEGLKIEVDAKQRQLADFYDKVKKAGGDPSSPAPDAPPPPEGVPTWVWLLGGGVVLAIGYSFYRTWGQVQSDRARLMTKIENTLPKLL